MMTLEQYKAERDRFIYEQFLNGKRQRWLAEKHKLSISRIKAICHEQKKLRKVQA